MKRLFSSRHFHRLNLPGAMLLALLQRTPAVRIAAEIESVIVRSPAGTVLRSVLTAVASLGAVQSMAGATPLVATPSSASNGLTATVGTSVNVFYTVTGTQTPPASWRVAGEIPPGLNFSNLTGSGGTVNVQNLNLAGTPTRAGTYMVTINAYEGVNATLTPSPDYNYTITVTGGSTDTAPSFTTQPQSQTVTAGTAVTFSAQASGSPTPTYQWRRDGNAINGATNTNFTINSASSADVGSYTVVATNTAGSATSNSATLTVNAAAVAPTFTTQPSAQVSFLGGSVTFNAAATGTPAPTYQWRRNGVNLANGGTVSGATSGSLTINGLTAGDAATYTVVATNSAGSAVSNGATLTLGSASNRGRIVNMSVLTSINAGEDFTFGYFIGGGGTSGTKSILMRAMGPSLSALGVGGVLPDPFMEFYNGSTKVTENNDWSGDAGISAAVTAVQAFPFLSAGSKDAAIFSSSVGSEVGHSIKVSGRAGTAGGIVIAELYDATPGSQFTTATPRLINVSLIKNVGASTTIGFFIDGATPVKVLVRAVGPTLNSLFGLASMADPKMALFVQGAQTSFATNDDWSASTDMETARNATGAFPLPNGSKDAALLQTLQPGGYSVQVSAATGATGVALIEVYEVP